jgi:hypothetical protein
MGIACLPRAPLDRFGQLAGDQELGFHGSPGE